MFEHRSDPLLPSRQFAARLTRHGAWGTSVLLVWLAVGVVGYHCVARKEWIDALLNASMILSGMGPVGTLEGDRAKLFASFYALVSGVVFLAAASVVIAPVLHRILHKFHLDEDGDGGGDRDL